MIAGMLAVIISVAMLLLRGQGEAAMLGLGALVVPLLFQLILVARTAEPQLSARPMAAYIDGSFPGAPVFLYRDFEAYGALPIYLRRPVPVIESRSADLYYGWRQHPEHPAFALEDDVVASGPNALVVVLDYRRARFEQTRLRVRMEAVHTVGKATLFRMRPARPSVARTLVTPQSIAKR
jgi:hypothetical protein